MKKFSIAIIRQYRPVRTCDCGIKYLDVQGEIDMGHKRTQCPWCDVYKHTHNKPPPITHNYAPMDFNDIIEL